MAKCSRCGEELETGSRFCGNCGLEVEVSGPAPGTSQAPAVPGGDQAPRGSYLKTGWHLFKQYPGGFIGFTALVLLIQAGLGVLPKVGWMVLFIQYPLMFGFVAVSSRLIQGERPRFGEFFNGFNFILTSPVGRSEPDFYFPGPALAGGPGGLSGGGLLPGPLVRP